MLPGRGAQPSIPIWRAFLGSLLLMVGSFPATQFAGTGAGQTPAATITTLTYLAEADTYASSLRVRRNFGGGSALRTDGTPEVRSFLRFDLGGMDAPISDAVLRVFAGSTSATGIDVGGVSTNSWSETTLTFLNSPRVTAAVDSSGPIRAGTWVDWDVTSLLRSGRPVSFALTSTSPTATRLASRESSNPPQLVLSASLLPESPPISRDTPPAPPPASADGSLSPRPPDSPASPPVGVPAIRDRSTPSPSPLPRSPSREFVVMGAGDIACEPPSLPAASVCHEFYTSDLLGPADVVLTFGDNQYQDGTLDKFLGSYDRSWGRFKVKTRPAVGNHDYLTPGAAGYFDYFGRLAGERGKGYYSFNVGDWHFVALNSQCSQVGGCGPGSPQYQWLQADLAASTARCTAAYWHHPRFSGGQYHDDADYQPFWELLYADGAEIAMAGHDHNYQRYAPMTPDGLRDDVLGIRQFVVGTGGKNHYSVDSMAVPNREVADDSTYGVLKLTLRSDGYDWAFEPSVGGTFTDAGSGACH
ncbi:MAG TPA: DNRLRE domain-containing protein [Actinomycetota bacterium]|nr:DNRLRE domain-containing protein [Actinomycetota bacterium]